MPLGITYVHIAFQEHQGLDNYKKTKNMQPSVRRTDLVIHAWVVLNTITLVLSMLIDKPLSVKIVLWHLDVFVVPGES